MKKIITPTVVLTLSSLFAYCLGGHSRNLWGYPIAWILVAYSLLLQVVVAIPSMIFNTEKYYDLTGSLTFISITAIATFTNNTLAIEQIIAAGMVFAWAGRLGSFLFLRILKVGQDSRFVAIKKTKIRFFYAWIIQGLWIVVTIGPLLSVMISNNLEQGGELGLLEYAGIALWVVGILIEIVSDSQKSSFNDNPANKDKFISTGLWSYSRHPNYVGEITLWTGATIFAFSSLEGGQFITLINPIFVYLLLSKLSGVPMLEAKAESKWGSDKDYQNYRQNTPVLFPFIKESAKPEGEKKSK